MKKLRIGIVGCGFIATDKHMRALALQSDKVEMVGFCDLIIEKARASAERFGTPDAIACESYHVLTNDPAIDVIHVCTPNVSHCEITCAALEAGKHVMCEKPMAVTAAEADRMVAAARRAGKKLSIGYQNRFREDAQFVKKAIDEGQLGDIYYGKAIAVRRRGVPTWGVFTDKAKQGGGPLIDIGTHALDLTLWYMNNYEVASVSGSCFYKLGNDPAATPGNGGAWDTDTYDVEDCAMGYIRMKNGAVITLEASWILNTIDEGEAICALSGVKGGSRMYEKSGENGTFYDASLNLTMGDKLVSIRPKIKTTSSFKGKTYDHFDYSCMCEGESWVDAILNDSDPLVLPEQAATVTRILEAIYVSAKTGKEVVFD